MRYRENVQYEAEGNRLINKIETYQSIHHRLPDNLADLNEEGLMSIGPYYEKISEERYQVYFCIGFDTYKTYDSETEEWTWSTQ